MARIYKSTYKKNGKSVETDVYWINFRDHMQTRRRWPLGVANKRAAEAMAVKLGKAGMRPYRQRTAG